MQDLTQTQNNVLNAIDDKGQVDTDKLIGLIVDSLKGLSIVEAKVILEVSAIVAESRATI